MSLRLAEVLPFASGYAVETYELVHILEEFGGSVTDHSIRQKGVQILQIETKNPHIHEARESKKHLTKDMLLPSLSAVYHSSLCETSIKARILETLVAQGCLKLGEEPSAPIIYPPIKTIEFERFSESMKQQLSAYSPQAERERLGLMPSI
jgi:mannosyl-3-phosphoglycerate synthase